MAVSAPRLLVASNRLPLSLRRQGERWQLQESTGGLVAAIGPVLRRRGGVWIGWPGTANADAVARALRAETRRIGYKLRPVPLTGREREQFYNGFANEVVWPLFHDLQTFCNFQETYWQTYREVNRKFARAIRQEYQPGDYVWVHDYHLMGVGEALREARRDLAPGFFLHIPFPPPDIFRKLPWRQELLDGLFCYELLGFQTPGDLKNFLQCVEALRPDVSISSNGESATLDLEGRTVLAVSFPIGVDAAAIDARARAPEVNARVAARESKTRILFGIDRLDYTKGIPHKLRGYRRLLEKHPELRRKITLVQVVSPSRETIPRYHELKAEVEGLVGRINGEFTEHGWTPLQYLYRKVDAHQVLSWYRLAEVAVVTPLKDGMNLVAKEFCAANIEADGVLVLSEFAGAAEQFRDRALLVNPYNVEEVATAMHRALTMPAAERKERMSRMRRRVREHDIYWWVDRFLAAAAHVEQVAPAAGTAPPAPPDVEEEAPAVRA